MVQCLKLQKFIQKVFSVFIQFCFCCFVRFAPLIFADFFCDFGILFNEFMRDFLACHVAISRSDCNIFCIITINIKVPAINTAVIINRLFIAENVLQITISARKNIVPNCIDILSCSVNFTHFEFLPFLLIWTRQKPCFVLIFKDSSADFLTVTTR